MASMDFGDATETLANDDFWIDVAMLFVGFFGTTLVAMVVDGVVDLPNELYGIGVAAASEAFTDYRMITAGAGLYTADVLATRVGVKDKITAMAQNAGGA
jgi:hypothetical protein